ncbi:MAG: FCD domain-containing protein [Acidimicrobiia bacterium]|nr:FCD domain-containing protein [Acidimicrobiia bacterium]
MQKSVVEDALDQLRSMIHRGDIGPGGQLPPERVLAEQLGVGRLSLRDAIGRLTSEGYVVSRRGAKGGTFVTELKKPFTDWVVAMRESPENLDEILEMRIALESRAAVLACRRRTDHDIVEMKDAHVGFDGATAVIEKRNADNRFHHALADASSSRLLVSTLSENRGSLFPPTHAEVYAELLATRGNDHTEILNAVIERDEARACEAIEDHVSGTRSVLLELLERSR